MGGGGGGGGSVGGGGVSGGGGGGGGSGLSYQHMWPRDYIQDLQQNLALRCGAWVIPAFDEYNRVPWVLFDCWVVISMFTRGEATTSVHIFRESSKSIVVHAERFQTGVRRALFPPIEGIDVRFSRLNGRWG